ncbi:MAG: 3'-5' exonuclease [Corynebacterium sp.]|nr:3'-5' exonuclease [Corynebacterium sp.]
MAFIIPTREHLAHTIGTVLRNLHTLLADPVSLTPLPLGATASPEVRVYHVPDLATCPGVNPDEQYVIVFLFPPSATSTSSDYNLVYAFYGTEQDMVAKSKRLNFSFNAVSGAPEIYEVEAPVEDTSVTTETETSTISPAPEAEQTPAKPEVQQPEEPTAPAVPQVDTPVTPMPESVQTEEELPPTSVDNVMTSRLRKQIDSSNSGIRILAEGHTPDSLYHALGLPPAVTERVLATTTAKDLVEVIAHRPSWERQCYLGLAAGTSVENLREDFQLEKPDHSKSKAELLEDSLQNPIYRNDFIIAENEEELRYILETQSFNRWRVYLHNTQQYMATQYFRGSARVFGGAGTGKTVVAVHRAKNLHYGLDSDQGTRSRIVLTTFTKTLATSLRRMMRDLDASAPSYMIERLGEEGVLITNIDDLVSQVIRLGSAHEFAQAWDAISGVPATDLPRTLGDDEFRQFLTESAAIANTDLPAHLVSPLFLADEWHYVILQNKIHTQIDYLRTPRRGRGQKLGRGDRIALWRIFENVRTRIATTGKMDFPTRAVFASELIDPLIEAGKIDREKLLIDHLIIDEAQDLHVGHWVLIRKIVPSADNDIFISEDGHQRIYRKPITLSHFDINVRGRSRRLKINYRTTEENLELANKMLAGPEVYLSSEGEAESMDNCVSLRSGPMPEIIQAQSAKYQAKYVAQQIRKWRAQAADPDLISIGILIRESSDAGTIAQHLAEEEISAAFVRSAEQVDNSNVIPIITMHSSKGLEFSHVVIMNAGKVPDHIDMKDPDARKQEQSLMYVATSRARDILLITSLRGRNEYLLDLIDPKE